MPRLVTAFLLGQRSEHTRRAYRSDIRHFLAWCAQHHVDALRARRVHIDAYVASMAAPSPRTGRPAAESTVARRLATLAGLYAYGIAEDLLDRSPLGGVHRPRLGQDSTSTGLARDEVARLLAAAAADGARAHALLSLLAHNGLRIDEALSRDVDHLQTERGHQVLRLRRKGGHTATAPLAPPVVHALQVYLDGRETGPLFMTRTGRRMDEPAAWRLIRRLARRAELPQADRINPHTLRHGFVTAALDAGVSLRDVQDSAGHADPRTTRAYDRSRHNLDRHATYAVSAYYAEGQRE
ncbi:tyrosine-type recombinase/integrase [Pseudonocardia dioxanivorans]|uniref:tyrosine-type recombinase/integrase n=1 Tax=Pseudonocardia dioxanivorans TaxID=240495 RepID=UPI0003174A0D|nr:tyrosine-type recombinase/integrase [Pseudonocardia dioxanivorans]